MIQQLKEAKRFNGTVLLACMCLFCLGLSMARYLITGSKMYIFLNWNLFLAFIPWILSTTVIVYKYQSKKILMLILLFSWLLFFPNSPYILTDLFHLRSHSLAPVWFDWALIISFAWTGLMFGFASLQDIEKILSIYIKKKRTFLVIILLLFIAGFGVYIGRFLRWNSWDVVSDPFALADDILERVFHPLLHAQTWIITLLLGVLLNMMYFSGRVLRR